MKQPNRYKLEDYELDLQCWELRRAGRLVPLQPRQLQLLGYLVLHRNRLVSKTELLDALWPGTFVSDHALWTAIRAIRRALDDSAPRSCMLLTRRNLGFRFVGNVRESSEESEACA